MSDVTEEVAKAINRAGIEWLEENDPKRQTLGWADVPDEVFAVAAINAYEASKPKINQKEE